MRSLLLTLAVLFVAGANFGPYPIDGFDYTGIRRLHRAQAIVDGKIPGTKPPPGALKSLGEIRLTLANKRQGPTPLPEEDPSL